MFSLKDFAEPGDEIVDFVTGERYTVGTGVLAHNTDKGVEGTDVPLIIEYPENYPFEPGERERDWHEASEEEYERYLTYWDAED